MKLTKRLLSLVLALAMCATLCVPALAAPAESGMEGAGVSCQKISFEEAAMQKMEYDGVSYAEAKAQLLAEEARILAERDGGVAIASAQPQARDIIEYFDYDKIVSYPENTSFECMISAVIVTFLDTYNSRLIDRVEAFTSAAVGGLGLYKWNELDKAATISIYNTSVDFTALGQFETEMTSTVGDGFSLKGFSTTSSFGFTYYLRSDVLRARGTYSVH